MLLVLQFMTLAHGRKPPNSKTFRQAGIFRVHLELRFQNASFLEFCGVGSLFRTNPVTVSMYVHSCSSARLNSAIGWRSLCLFSLFAFFGVDSLLAGQPLIELKVGTKTLQGKSVAHDSKRCWLMERDGHLHEVDLAKVSSFKSISSKFRPSTASEVRDQLRREMGGSFEIKGTGHYLVCAARGEAGRYAEIFEDLYRSFHTYFATRGFRIEKPEFPLVAIVFPDHALFDAYCQKDGFRAVRGLMGYYQPNTNRIALFDPISSKQSTPVRRNNGSGTRIYRLQLDSSESSFHLGKHFEGYARGAVDADLQSTIVHEATHQVAFNTGLHSRIGESPRWVVEGLAMAFESPGNRANSRRGTAMARANRERFIWFGNYSQSRRESGFLQTFVASDNAFRTATLDAYSEAWALTFFLLETRPSKYAGYLKRIARRPALETYSPKQRVADFRSSFGSDLKMLEAEYLRFIARLK